jgi:putative chitobiose transport system substrate-binding protein
MKKIGIICIMLGMLLILFTGCGKKDVDIDGGAGVKEISFFTMQLRPTFDDYFLELFKEFEASHPGVKIRWMDYPAQNYETKLLTSFIGSNPPDVINLTAQMVPKFVNTDCILPLKDNLPEGIIDSYFQNVIKDACTVNDKVYALPWYLASVVTMVNMNIFKEAGLSEDDIPETFEELRKVCEIVKEKTDKFAFFPIYTEAGVLRGYLIEAGIPVLNESENKAVFNTPEAVKIVKYWTDLYKDGLVPSESLTATHRRPIEMFKSGHLAIFHTGPQFLKHVKSDSEDVYNNTVVKRRLHWENNELYMIDVHNMVVSKKSKHPKLAAEFAAFVTNGKNQLKFCKMTTIFPSVREAADDSYFTEPDDSPEGQARNMAIEAIKKGIVVRTPEKHAGKLARVLDDIMEKICTGDISPEEALKSAEEKWNEILQD